MGLKNVSVVLELDTTEELTALEDVPAEECDVETELEDVFEVPVVDELDEVFELEDEELVEEEDELVEEEDELVEEEPRALELESTSPPF